MSWSFSVPKNTPAPQAKEQVASAGGVPQGIRDYVTAGIDGLIAKHGDDVKVDVTGYGHLFTNDGSVEETTASIDVRVSKGE